MSVSIKITHFARLEQVMSAVHRVTEALGGGSVGVEGGRERGWRLRKQLMSTIKVMTGLTNNSAK